MPKANQYIALSQAAKISGYTAEYLRQLCVKGKLEGQKIGKSWVTTAESVVKFQQAQLPLPPTLGEIAGTSVFSYPKLAKVASIVLALIIYGPALANFINLPDKLAFVKDEAGQLLATTQDYADQKVQDWLRKELATLGLTQNQSNKELGIKNNESANTSPNSSFMIHNSNPENQPGKILGTTITKISSDDLITSLRSVLSSGLPNDIKASLTGPPGPPGPPGQTPQYIPNTGGASFSTVIPTAMTVSNNGGGTLAGVTFGSADQFAVRTLVVSGTTTVTGATTLGTTLINGALTVTGSTTTLSDLAVSGNASLTGNLTVGGTSTLTGTLTSNGQLIATKVPTLAHMFAPAWPTGTSNVSNATLYINPASSIGDGNLIGAAVNGSVKFVVDAEGDIYGANLILSGSTTTGATTIAGNLTVQDNTTLGDASGDLITPNGAFNKDIRILKTNTATAVTQYPSYDLRLQASSWDTGGGGSESVNDFILRNIGQSGAGANYRLGIFNNAAASELVSILQNGNVGIGTTNPGTDLALVKGKTGVTGFQMGNTSAGTGNRVELIQTNDAGDQFTLDTYSSTWTTSGPQIANGTLLSNFAAGGLGLRAQSASGQIYFYTGGTSERMRIDSSGNVGIGTTNPVDKLEVNGGIHSSGCAANSKASEILMDYCGEARFLADGPDNSTNAIVDIASRRADGSNTYRVLYGDASGHVGINTLSSANQLGVNGNVAIGTYSGTAGPANGLIVSGNVGIGTTIPGSLLNLYSSGTPELQIQNSSATGNASILIGSSNVATSGAKLWWDGTTETVYLDNLRDLNSKLISFRVRAAGTPITAMTITGTAIGGGLVGVGTTNPSTPLHVNGSSAVSTVQFRVTDSAPQAADIGAKISLGGTSNDAGDLERFVDFKAGKNNGTSGDASAYLAILTNAGAVPSEKMRITSTGNVGIGTTNPFATLEVASSNTGTSQFGANINSLILQNKDQTANNWSSIIFNDSANGAFVTSIQTKYTDHTNDYGELHFSTRGAAGLADRMTIDQNGNVGIGTTGPATNARLHVVSAGAGAIPASSGTTQSTGLIQRLGTSANNAILDIGQNGGSGLWLQSTDSTNLSAVYNLLLNPNGGNVLIGTTTDTPFSGLAAFKTSIVNGTGTNGLVLPLSGSGGSGTNIVQMNDSTYIGTLLRLQTTRAANSAFNFLNISAGANGTTGADGTSVFFIRGDGNVGIGTTGPSALLNVYGGKVQIDGSATAATVLNVAGTYTASGAIQREIQAAGTQIVAANNDVISGIMVAPTVTAGAFTGVTYEGIHLTNPAGTGTIATNYGLYIENQTKGTTNYAIYSNGGTNYFAGNVGIGTTNPGNVLDVESGSSSGLIQTVLASGNAVGPQIGMVKERGTLASPTAILANDLLGKIQFSGYNNAAVQTGSAISSVATAVTGTTITTDLEFLTVNAGTGGTVLTLTGAGVASFNGNVVANNGTFVSGSLANAPATGTCASQANSATQAVFQTSSSVTSSHIFYNSTRGKHARITSVATCTDGSSLIWQILTLTDSITGQVATDAYTVYSVASDLGTSSAGFFNNAYIINGKFVTATTSGGFDVAEQYETSDATIKPGEVVSINAMGKLVKAQNDDNDNNNDQAGSGQQSTVNSHSSVIGIISTNPGLTLGNETIGEWRKVALTGRIPVKFSLENGPIKAGDRLTISKTLPGFSMKLIQSGQSIGTSLEGFDGSLGPTGKVLMFVNLSYQHMDVAANATGDKILVENDYDFQGHSIVNIKAIVALNNKWSIDENGVIVAIKVKADVLETKKGVTILDHTNGQPYCVYVDAGLTKTLAGACDDSNTWNQTQGGGNTTGGNGEGTLTQTPGTTADTTTTAPAPAPAPTPAPTPAPDPTPAPATSDSTAPVSTSATTP